MTIRWWRNWIEFTTIPQVSNYLNTVLVLEKQEDGCQLVLEDEDTKEANGTTQPHDKTCWLVVLELTYFDYCVHLIHVKFSHLLLD